MEVVGLTSGSIRMSGINQTIKQEYNTTIIINFMFSGARWINHCNYLIQTNFTIFVSDEILKLNKVTWWTAHCHLSGY